MLEFYADLAEGTRSNDLTLNAFMRSLPFYGVSCGEFFTGERYCTKREGLKNYLLLVTVDGLGRISQQGQTSYLEAGSAVVIDCDLYQEYGTVPDHSWHFYYLHFNALSVEGYRSALLQRLTAVSLRSPEKAWEQMEELYRLSFGADVETYVKISNIISDLLTEMVCSLADGSKKENRLNRSDISELTEYIRENCREELHIDDFMKVTKLSRHYLIHIFKEQIGMSPYQYLHMCRINRAQTLLTSTDMTVEQIAYHVGYNSPAVFIRHFKFFNKITPLTYRREFFREI